MKRPFLSTAIVFSTSVFVAANASAQPVSSAPSTLPLWEVGIGALGLVAPDYPGADEYRYLALPFPNIIYRGQFLRADRQGVRGIFVETPNLEVNVSVDGNLPTDSDNEAREGMPELDPLVEIGPSVKYTFWKDTRSSIGAQLPVRAAFSVFGDDDFIAYQGIVVNPEAIYTTKREVLGKPSQLVFTAGPIFGYDGINDYYYSVSPQEATFNRQAYEASDGYMGSEVSGRIGMILSDRVRFFLSGNLTYLGGAENRDSSLFREDLNATIATGITWSLYQSKKYVPASR